MINKLTPTTYGIAVSSATDSRVMCASTAERHGLGVRVVAPFAVAMQGTSVPAAKFRSDAAATALLPIDVVVNDVPSGTNAWKPPV